MTPQFSLSLRTIFVLGLLVWLCSSLRADSDVVVDKLNKKIENVTLHDADGRPHSLYDVKDKKAIVVVFLSFECPVSTSYIPVLTELAKIYRDKQVLFFAVNSSDDGDAAQITKRGEGDRHDAEEDHDRAMHRAERVVELRSHLAVGHCVRSAQ